MEVIRAAHAGFCMGVDLALRKLDDMVASSSSRVATMGEIIHNPQVLAQYAEKGVVCIHSPEEADENMSVLIRAHGLPKNLERDLKNICPNIKDATCPRVKKAQLSIERATSDGKFLFLYGEQDHPEVRGLISYAVGDSLIFSSLEELERTADWKALAAKNTVLAAQTTQDRLVFESVRRCLEEHLEIPPLVLDTICDATRERQSEVEELAEKVKAVVIVGGRNSGNTRRLTELAKARCALALQVETAAELDQALFAGIQTVGLTAGASTPSSLIDEVERLLKSW